MAFAERTKCFPVNPKKDKLEFSAWSRLEATTREQRQEFESAVGQQQREFQASMAQQQEEIKALRASLKEQAAQIQKVSAQLAAASPSGGGLEMSRRAQQTVVSSQ
jgi:septal ring factor EnvC (AmiA/AmiB activator)